MSFGEHLEELRWALAMSALGIVIALAITFPLAQYAVHFVERPLARALERYYRAEARDDMLAASARQPLSLAEWQLLSEERLVPRRVRIDVEAVRAMLDPPSAEGQTPAEKSALRFQPADLAPGNAVLLAQKLLSGAEKPDPARLVLDAMPDLDRNALEKQLHDVSAPGQAEAIRQRMIEALNGCLVHADLAENPTIRQQMDRLGSGYHALGKELLHAWDAGNHQALRPQVNRMLLSAVFPELIHPPRIQLAELTIWEPGTARIQTLGVPEAFMAWMKAWLVLAVLVASPWVFYQLWLFVAAGLYGHERSFVYMFLPFSLGLFLAGAALAFAFVFDPVLDFLFTFNRKLNISIEPRFSDWIGFVLLLPLGFGISFQLPLVMLLLERLGLVTVATYISRWRISILIIFVVSMVLTPADPISMLLMAIPLTGLYFGGILLCRWLPRSAPAAQETASASGHGIGPAG